MKDIADRAFFIFIGLCMGMFIQAIITVATLDIPKCK